MIHILFNGSCGRKQYIVVEGTSSDSVSVVSGVPQGSVLGPLLFLTYINCVGNLELSECSRLTMYADDILLMKPIRGFNDFIHLQRDIDIIANCIDNLRLSLNTAKCKYIILYLERNNLLFCLWDYI